ncbi:S41 family peptidase [Sphingomonas naphthae]|uniref:S41 family peptidase n=1 Tax=Sphingomonas naphthae TaxID=1813468 RepID=A0ABY7TSF7_9SPHN|nr:S41 family peptidase [Sphingomonas naphthae]WCT75164.1 S41 family peptidase [Sphingomonas naphthae]
MKRALTSVLCLAVLLSGCGGGGSGGTTATPTPTATTPTPTPTPTPTASTGCTLRERQDWAAAQLREWYLFPETLPSVLDPAAYASVDDYIDALTATARAQGKDRYFTYLTSIAEENAYNNSGDTAGFGFRIGVDSTQTRVYITETFEGAPALAAGIDRGAEILGIGTTPSTIRTINQIAREDNGSLTNALGPDTVGTTRTFQISQGGTNRAYTISKANFLISPVSSRYGSQIIDYNGGRYGYINLRTFIRTADDQMRTAFASFRAAGITNVVVDLRYNGGGLITTAQLMGDLLGGNRSTSDVFNYITFRPEKSVENQTRFFAPQPQSISPMRISFIGLSGTASASELVINAFIPFLGNRAALVGANTYGKPVGQIALDRPACDDRLRVVALATENGQHQGTYYSGLASKVGAFCAAGDTYAAQLGSTQDSLTNAALSFAAGLRTCPAGTGGTDGISTRALARSEDITPLRPDHPSVAQRDIPGLF